MAASTQSNQTEHNPVHEPVPSQARMGRLSLTMAWWAVCSAMFYIVVGASLALSYGARNALIGMLLSVISYGLVNSVLSRFAIRSGLSVALFSRLLFGSTGACLATLIFFSTAIYYAVFEGSVIAVALNHLYPQLAYPVAALVVVLYSVPLILGSVQHWLDKFNGVLLPVYLGGLLVAVGLSINRYGYQPQWLDFGPETPSAFGWWDCFVAYMGVWILMLFTFDYARFGKTEDAGYHGRWNFGMPFYAGWGATHDRRTCPRRAIRRTAEEIFAAAYMLYARYVNPVAAKRCDIHEAIRILAAQRFQNERN